MVLAGHIPPALETSKPPLWDTQRPCPRASLASPHLPSLLFDCISCSQKQRVALPKTVSVHPGEDSLFTSCSSRREVYFPWLPATISIGNQESIPQITPKTSLVPWLLLKEYTFIHPPTLTQLQRRDIPQELNYLSSPTLV